MAWGPDLSPGGLRSVPSSRRPVHRSSNRLRLPFNRRRSTKRLSRSHVHSNETRPHGHERSETTSHASRHAARINRRFRAPSDAQLCRADDVNGEKARRGRAFLLVEQEFDACGRTGPPRFPSGRQPFTEVVETARVTESRAFRRRVWLSVLRGAGTARPTSPGWLPHANSPAHPLRRLGGSRASPHRRIWSWGP